MDVLDRLLVHDEWATRQLLERCRTLTDAQLDQEFDIGHRSLRMTFDHMIPNLCYWPGLMTGESSDEIWDVSSLDSIIAYFDRAFAAFAANARRVRDEGRLEVTFNEQNG